MDVLPPLAGQPAADGLDRPVLAALCRRIVAQIRRAADEAVLELGAGTGVVSRALLDAGLPAERLIVVEIVPDMARASAPRAARRATSSKATRAQLARR